MRDVVAPPPIPRIPVADATGVASGTFPVRRIYCVGRNFAEHAREMGAVAPTSKAERGTPVFFLKPADAVVVDGLVPYPPATADLHHEVELVVALGSDAPVGMLPLAAASEMVFAVGVGLDLTRRDLQAAAKAKGLPWDTGKSFDHAAPVSTLRRLADIGGIGALAELELTLHVNGQVRQHGALRDMVWDVPEILHELSRLYRLRAGDLVFMGTPSGVAALQPGDRFDARLGDVARLQGTVTPATV